MIYWFLHINACEHAPEYLYKVIFFIYSKHSRIQYSRKIEIFTHLMNFHFQKDGKPYCNRPCYAALFGPKGITKKTRLNHVSMLNLLSGSSYKILRIRYHPAFSIFSIYHHYTKNKIEKNGLFIICLKQDTFLDILLVMNFFHWTVIM